MRILLVDDDLDLLDVTSYGLRREGFNVIAASDGIQAIQRWRSDQPDLVVLDVGLPRLSGFEVCRRIRQSGSTPVILLTGLDDEEHVVQGFQYGADDYVTKPFSLRQLAMRIRAIWRRAASTTEPEPTRELRLGELSLDIESHSASRGDRRVQLTPLEFRLLYLLVSNAGRVVSSGRLVEYAWRYGHDGGDSSLLKTHICHLRQKLALPSNGPGSIRALHGVGYRFVAEAS